MSKNLLCIVLSALAFGTCNAGFSAGGVITNVRRQVEMLEPDVVVFTNEITYKPHQDISTFQYAVAADYENTLVDLTFRDSLQVEGHLTKRRV